MIDFFSPQSSDIFCAYYRCICHYSEVLYLMFLDEKFYLRYQRVPFKGTPGKDFISYRKAVWRDHQRHYDLWVALP